MSKYMTFFEAWHFLQDHPMFKREEDKGKWGKYGYFEQCLDIMVVQVNPENDTIDDDSELNTKTAVWLECGPYDPQHGIHNIELDTGADTFEEAVVNLAQLVLKHPDYGDYVKPEMTEQERFELDEWMKKIIARSEGE